MCKLQATKRTTNDSQMCVQRDTVTGIERRTHTQIGGRRIETETERGKRTVSVPVRSISGRLYINLCDCATASMAMWMKSDNFRNCKIIYGYKYICKMYRKRGFNPMFASHQFLMGFLGFIHLFRLRK